MSCPNCGSSESRLVAPGYVECAGVLTMDEVTPVGRLERRSVVCGSRYHTSVSAQQVGGAQCSCGLYVIGSCPRCGTSYCGDHSWLRDGQRLCGRCAQQFDDQTANVKAEQQQALLAQVAASQANDRATFPVLARAVFAARPELVRTFVLGYHRGWIGRSSAPRVKVIYAGYASNRSSDDRAVLVYCVDEVGGIYSVDLAYGPHYHAEPTDVDSVRCSRMAEFLRSLMDRRECDSSSHWAQWRSLK